MIGCRIELEMQLGDTLQVKVLTEATPEVSLGTVQPFDRFLFFFFTAHNADMRPGILEIVAQLNPSDGLRSRYGDHSNHVESVWRVPHGSVPGLAVIVYIET